MSCKRKRRALTSALSALLLLLGCQHQPVSLMPTPEAFRTGEIELFSSTPPWARTRVIPVLFATNRLPADEGGYSAAFDDSLRLGIADIFVGGDPAADWNDLVAISTVEQRRADVPLMLQGVRQYYALPVPVDPERPQPEVLDLLAELDRLVSESRDPDLLIFVHGANNTFERSAAQAAQYRHFTGRHSVVLSFDWPSTGKIWRYGTDVTNARHAAALLADLVELIALHTQVRRINVLGYSLGSLVVSNGLFSLRARHRDEDAAALKQRLRIGEVFYTAADIGTGLFVEQLRNYLDIVDRVSLTVNPNDSVLGWSSLINRSSRAGRPDPESLTDAQIRWLRDISHTPGFDLIAVEAAMAPYGAFELHDYWYENPRVSTDVLMQMLTHAAPDKRGLVRTESPRQMEVWSFPEDYRARVLAAVQALRSEQ